LRSLKPVPCPRHGGAEHLTILAGATRSGSVGDTQSSSCRLCLGLPNIFLGECIAAVHRSSGPLKEMMVQVFTCKAQAHMGTPAAMDRPPCQRQGAWRPRVPSPASSSGARATAPAPAAAPAPAPATATPPPTPPTPATLLLGLGLGVRGHLELCSTPRRGGSQRPRAGVSQQARAPTPCLPRDAHCSSACTQGGGGPACADCATLRPHLPTRP